MTEVDIWIKVFDKLNFELIEEYTDCGFSSGRLSHINQIKYKSEGDTYSLYFNRKNESVTTLFTTTGKYTTVSVDWTTKESFYNKHIDLFREVKLENIL